MIVSILDHLSRFHYSELFATVPGITLAVVGTIGAIMVAVFGRFKKFQLPSESAPGLSRGFLNFVLFIPFILCFVMIKPDNAVVALLIALVGVPAAWAAMLAYGKELSNHRYTRPISKRFLFWERVGEEVVIGGTTLTSTAQAMAGVSLQEMLAKAEYKADEIWERESRTGIQQRIEFFYYLFLIFAVTTVSAGALATQALIAREAPLLQAQIIWDKGHSPMPGNRVAKPSAG